MPRQCRSSQNTYFAFTPDQMPAVLPGQPAGDSAILQGARVRVSDSEQARSRHILIKVASAPTPKPMPLPGQSRRGCSSRSRAARTLPIWQRRTPTTPAAKTRAAIGLCPSRHDGAGVRQRPLLLRRSARPKIVKSSFGYHLVQVEERQDAHTQSLSEVLPTIQATLFRQEQLRPNRTTLRRSPRRPSRTAWRRPPQPIILKWPPRRCSGAGRDLSAA